MKCEGPHEWADPLPLQRGQVTHTLRGGGRPVGFQGLGWVMVSPRRGPERGRGGRRRWSALAAIGG
uniref:Uncharacterized protein n=1 Tax=uncultured marine virus TaxID=186617 RepID=A0A0F7L6N4_9VIRU|nr:hypothetical protein [uncultured marine virus]